MFRFADLVLRLVFGVEHPLPETDVFAHPGPSDRRHRPQRRTEVLIIRVLLAALLFLRSLAVLTLLLLLLRERGQNRNKLAERPGYRQADRPRPGIGKLADGGAPGDGNGSEAERKTPLLAIQRYDLECLAADEDDKHLSTNHDGVYDDKEPVACDALEDVEPIIQSPIAEFIEDLQPNESVEDQCVQSLFLTLAYGRIGVVDMISKQRSPSEIEDKGDGQLADDLAHDHLAHPSRDEWSRLPVRLAVQDTCTWGVGGQR